jgi:predicted ATP-binding protein involved in virulence
MRIVKISVTKLFGTFDHVIPLNVDERITIIHGKNGVGKTSLLKLINSFFNLKYSEIRAIPFAEFRIDFDDQSYASIRKLEVEDEKIKDSDRKIEFSFVDSKKNPQDSFIPDMQAERLNKEIRPGVRIVRIKKTNVPDWFDELRDFIKVRFIESQRLLNLTSMNREGSMVSSVTTYSQELAKSIQAKSSEYGNLSQSLDRSFPIRVVQSHTFLSNEQLKTKLDSLETKRKELIDAGLLKSFEDNNLPIEYTINDSTKQLLSVYFEDVQKKLNIFKEISSKIELFKSIINKKFSYKSIAINQENGFIFTTDDGEILSATDLSSGEQHELVMIYELLFKVKPNSLILIDEPEISLHVEWKRQFLKDLQEITKLANLDVLLSTHSPTLINDRWDLTVALK